jgi:AcrR family transcriptional regulator
MMMEDLFTIAGVPAAEPGHVETKKADKRRRIREAARALFSKHGYDDTTVRMIARRARVAHGTVLLYARDKRDLVLLIFNHEIPRTLDRALDTAQRVDGLLDKLAAYFGVLYEDFYDKLMLSRIHLQLNHYSAGMHSAEYYSHRKRVSDFLQDAVRQAQRSGEIAHNVDPAVAAKLFFFVQSAAVRWWIASEAPDLNVGINELRNLFALQISGLAPRGALARSSRRTRRVARGARVTARNSGAQKEAVP